MQKSKNTDKFLNFFIKKLDNGAIICYNSLRKLKIVMERCLSG